MSARGPAAAADAPVTRLAAWTIDIPTETPEADGTLEWDSTTIVLVETEAGGDAGLGYTYASRAAFAVIEDVLAPCVLGRDAFAGAAVAADMLRQVRNIGRQGISACAIAAVDTALWDLRAKLCGQPLCNLLGRLRTHAPIYGSGGFTNYTRRQLERQLDGFVRELGCKFVKMKIGADPAADPARIAFAREVIGEAALMVDANGALERKQALALAHVCAEHGVVWFEEPLSSDDVAGLAWLRAHAPAPVAIAAGEYAWDVWALRTLLEAGAVDALQADATRCLGVTGFMQAAALAAAFHTPLSSHCAPTLHCHLSAATPMAHVEWFFDHARIERMLFDGAPEPRNGRIAPDLSRPGLGLALKRQDAMRLSEQSGRSLRGEWRL
ncbi:MAG TPA: enolase C-terminal domain-like protein [Vitreimonas sp.]|uniref:enolase C-terminal domain-like protein n=1 Tax=Vitreimonas sp. TaxID=3069702 RepID=UPI002D75B4D8|nr:enolase C-terminal domain-like protein [Vitreimonas sp.]HYD89285.1 enolase C-terminal domain-like protein [Vitreimonas sp.]